MYLSRCENVQLLVHHYSLRWCTMSLFGENRASKVRNVGTIFGYPPDGDKGPKIKQTYVSLYMGSLIE